ncbi:MAG: hypothetical protein HY706_10710 [Candidatus Hydrogenedentes bacterium]|nr:hypothetical protein [Candidatus Hydrogenedentota bacterium]
MKRLGLALVAGMLACMVAHADATQDRDRQAGVASKSAASGSVTQSQSSAPISHSSFLHAFGDNNVVNRQVVSRTVVRPVPGQTFRAWGPGFFLAGTGGHFHGPLCQWIAGHYEWQHQYVWVPGGIARRYIPPIYDTRWVNGREVLILIAGGRYETIQLPGRYEPIPVQVWVPGYWRCC